MAGEEEARGDDDCKQVESEQYEYAYHPVIMSVIRVRRGDKC